MSLAGKRVLITRSRTQASGLTVRLQELGAETISVPAIEIAPPSSYYALDAALACVQSFDWVVFTSVNAVQAFVERARQQRILPSLGKVAVVGPATAKAVEAAGFRVDLTPPVYVAEALGEALAPYAAHASILMIRAEIAPNLLPNMLQAAGGQVTVASAYRTVVPRESAFRLQRLFSDTASFPDAITFTSASTVTNFLSLLDESGLTLPRQIGLISIGPVTSHMMRSSGMEPTGEADQATLESLCKAISLSLGAENADRTI